MINSFLTYLRCELNFSAHTVLSYSTDINQFAEFITNGDIPSFHPASITPSDIRLWMMHLSSSGVAMSSVRRKVSALSSFYRFLMRTRGFTSNPASDTQVAKVPRRLPVFIRPDEMQEVIASEEPDDDTFLDELFERQARE